MKSFTIIIPCFNSEKYLKECLESILKINYSKELIEVLIINDGSTDKTEEISNEYINKYSFIKYYKKDNNHWGSVLNYVKNNKLANNNYVSVLDSDDKLLPEALNILNQLSNKNDVDLLVGTYKKWNGYKTKGNIIPYWFLFKKYMFNKQQMNTPLGLPLTFFSKKEIFYKMQNLTEKMAYQDPDYLSQLIKYSKSLAFTKKTIGYYYYNRDGNSMSEPWDENRFKSEYNACLKLIKNDAQEIVAFHLCQKKLRKIIDLNPEKSFEINRKFSFKWFPLYLRPIFVLWFLIKIKKYFKINY